MHTACAATVQQPEQISRKVRKSFIDKIPLFAGILQTQETSSKASRCLNTAEVAGSNPASSTRKSLPPYCNATAFWTSESGNGFTSTVPRDYELGAYVTGALEGETGVLDRSRAFFVELVEAAVRDRP
jgi:hypothetical protein